MAGVARTPQEPVPLGISLFPFGFKASDNPAFSGYRQRFSLQLSYENVAPDPFPLSRLSLGVESPGKHSFGFYNDLDLHRDIANTETDRWSYTSQITYAYQWVINRDLWIRAGTGLKIFTDRHNNQNSYADQIDPTYGFLHPTKEVPVNPPTNNVGIDAGMMLNYKKGYLAVAANRVINLFTWPSENMDAAAHRVYFPRRWTASTGYEFKITQSLHITPALDFEKRGNLPHTWSPAVYLHHGESILVGMRYYHLREFQPQIGLRLWNTVALMANLGYSPDDNKDLKLLQPVFWSLSLMIQF